MSDPLSKLSWDDLRIIKAIGERGGLAAAAEALGLNHSTLSRRLAAVEETLGVVLFDRRRSGYTPTSAGAEMVALGDRVEKDVLSSARRVSGHVQGHAGDLRVTTADALLLDFLTPIIADFLKNNPEVRVEVIVGNKPLNLARGDSDIAFRATTAPPKNLFGRKAATVAWAVYGRRIDYIGASPTPDELYQRQWAAYGRGPIGPQSFPIRRGSRAARKNPIPKRFCRRRGFGDRRRHRDRNFALHAWRPCAKPRTRRPRGAGRFR
jgi:DNA-binding transcriptional LysR family regulator